MSANQILHGNISNYVKNPFINQCSWKITITTPDNESIDVSYPLTLNFNITRNTLASSNTASFTIYNLAPATRNSKFFFKDLYNVADVKAIKFEAGYNGNFVLVFSGLVTQSYSWRNGTNIETHIEAMEMGFGASYVSATFEVGTTKKDAYKYIVSQSGLKLGAIGTLNGEFKQETSFMGRPIDILNEITGGHTFVDCGVVHTIQDNEALDYGIEKLNARSGLISTPKRKDTQIIVDSIFNPNFIVGQLLEIESVTESRFSGTYKVCGITHSGTISATSAGERKTQLTLFTDDLPNSNYNVTNNPSGQSFSTVKKEEVVPVNKNYGNSVAEVYKYIKDHNGDITGYNKKITNRIYWKEMLLSDKNSNADIRRECTESLLSNCVVIAQKLTDFCNTYFSGKQISVHSAWRSTITNRNTEGAVDNSRHIYGQAIDFHLIGVDTPTLRSIFKAHWSGGLGIYSWGLHVDSRQGKVIWYG